MRKVKEAEGAAWGDLQDGRKATWRNTYSSRHNGGSAVSNGRVQLYSAQRWSGEQGTDGGGGSVASCLWGACEGTSSHRSHPAVRLLWVTGLVGPAPRPPSRACPAAYHITPFFIHVFKHTCSVTPPHEAEEI